MWFKLVNTGGVLMSFAMTGSTGTGSINIGTSTTGGFGTYTSRKDFSTTDGRWNVVGAANVLNMSSINHVSMSYDGASTANTPVFVANGSNFGVSLLQKPVGVMDMTYDDVIIGNLMNTSNVCNAVIEEVVVYNTNLTLQEQLRLYSPVKYIPLQIRPNNIFAYWPMDDFSDGATPSGSNTIRDRSSSNFHMTPVGTLTAKANQIVTSP